MKQVYIQQLITLITALSQTFDSANSLINVYFDRGYGSGGPNELTADDLVAFGLAPAHVASAITLFQQLQALRSGGAVTPADYDATLNQLRRDI